MTDRISIEGIRVHAFHGVLDSEREAGQEFAIDVHMFLDLSAPAATDELAMTVDYAEVAGAVHDLVSGHRWDLIETVAERVAEAVLGHAAVGEVEVTVHKPHAPVPAVIKDVSVTIRRHR